MQNTEIITMKLNNLIDNNLIQNLLRKLTNESQLFVLTSTILVILGYYFWNYINNKYLDSSKWKKIKKDDNNKENELEEEVIKNITNIDEFNNLLKKLISNNLIDNVNYNNENQDINSATSDTSTINNNSIINSILINDDALSVFKNNKNNKNAFSSSNLMKIISSISLTPTEETYSLLMQLCFKHNNTKQANEIFTMITNPQTPICNTSFKTYTSYLSSYFELQVFPLIQQQYSLVLKYRNCKDFISKGPKIEVSFLKNLDGSLYYNIINKTQVILNTSITVLSEYMNKNSFEEEVFEIIIRIIFFSTNINYLVYAEKDLVKKIRSSLFDELTSNQSKIDNCMEDRNMNNYIETQLSKVKIIDVFKHIIRSKTELQLSEEEISIYSSIISLIEMFSDYDIIENSLKEAFYLEADFIMFNKLECFQYKYNYNSLKKNSLVFFILNRIMSYYIKNEFNTDGSLNRRKKICSNNKNKKANSDNNDQGHSDNLSCENENCLGCSNFVRKLFINNKKSNNLRNNEEDRNSYMRNKNQFNSNASLTSQNNNNNDFNDFIFHHEEKMRVILKDSLEFFNKYSKSSVAVLKNNRNCSNKNTEFSCLTSNFIETAYCYIYFNYNMLESLSLNNDVDSNTNIIVAHTHNSINSNIFNSSVKTDDTISEEIELNNKDDYDNIRNNYNDNDNISHDCFYNKTSLKAFSNSINNNINNNSYISSTLFSSVIELCNYTNNYSYSKLLINKYLDVLVLYLNKNSGFSVSQKLFKENINDVYQNFLQNIIRKHNSSILMKDYNNYFSNSSLITSTLLNINNEGSNFLNVRNNNDFNYIQNEIKEYFSFITHHIMKENDNNGDELLATLSSETKALYIEALFMSNKTEDIKLIIEKEKEKEKKNYYSGNSVDKPYLSILNNEPILLSLIKGYSLNNDCISSISILKEYQNRKITLTNSSLSYLMKMYSSLNSEEKVLEKYDEIINSNTKPKLTCFASLIEVFLKKKKIDYALSIMNDIKQNKIILDESISNIRIIENFVVSLLMNKKLDKFIELVSYIIKNNNIDYDNNHSRMELGKKEHIHFFSYNELFIDKILNEVLNGKHNLKYKEILHLSNEVFYIMKCSNIHIKNEYFLKVGQILYSFNKEIGVELNGVNNVCCDKMKNELGSNFNDSIYSINKKNTDYTNRKERSNKKSAYFNSKNNSYSNNISHASNNNLNKLKSNRGFYKTNYRNSNGSCLDDEKHNTVINESPNLNSNSNVNNNDNDNLKAHNKYKRVHYHVVKNNINYNSYNYFNSSANATNTKSNINTNLNNNEFSDNCNSKTNKTKKLKINLGKGSNITNNFNNKQQHKPLEYYFNSLNKNNSKN